MRLKLAKDLKRRKRDEGAAADASPVELIQLLGTLYCDNEQFVFVIGGAYLPSVQLPPDFRYKILFRRLEEWNERDRMYEDAIELRKITPPQLHELLSSHPCNDEETPAKEIRGRGRQSRKAENYFGLKWKRRKEQKLEALTFHTCNPRDVHGDLHINVPSSAFFGQLFVAEVSKLLAEDPQLFSNL